MRQTTVMIIFAILTALGIYATFDLPLDLFPDIELPYVAISTSYPGAGPEEVEKRVTRPIESVISGVSGIEYLGSNSSSGSSLVYIQLTYGSNLDESMNDIRAKMDYAKEFLPDEAKTPMIYKMDPSMFPIMHYAISGNRTPEELRKYADDLTPKLEQIDGVASAYVSGGRDRAIVIEIPRDRLEAYNLTITQIAKLLAAQNIETAGGTITQDDLNYTISTVGEYSSLDDIRNTVISYKVGGGQSGIPVVANIRLRDIADVFDGYKRQSSLYYFNGVPCVEVSVLKQSGTNSVKTARAVEKRMAQIIKDAPSDITITLTQDSTDIIKRSVSDVASTAIQGALLAIIVLFVFLRSLQSTAIIGLTIPISLVVTLGIMYFSGMSLNLMTLAGLSLGVGMLVDNSIVILENIFTYREKGAKPVPAAILGSQEMMLAITASTLTTICVFLPLIMYKKELGIIGEIFQGLAFTVVISLVCSLIVALVLVPVLSSKYFKIEVKKRQKTGLWARIDARMTRFFDSVDEKYSRAIRWVLRHKKLTVGAIAGLFVLSLASMPLLGFVYMPNQVSDSIVVNATLPVGTKVETTEAVMKQLEEIVKKEVRGYKNLTVLAGISEIWGMGGTSSFKGSLTIALPKLAERKDSEETIKDKIRKHFGEFPGVTFEVTNGDNQGVGGGSSAINISVKSDDLVKARNTAAAIRDLLAAKMPDALTEPAIDMKEGLPRANIVIDRARLYNLGLNVYDVGEEIKANIEGTTATKYREEGEEIDIDVMLAERDKTRLTDLEQIFVTNSSGQRIPVSSFAHYAEGTSPISITREDQSRIVHVTAGKKPEANLNEVQKRIETLVKTEIPADSAVRIEYKGDYEDMQKAIKQFIVIILMAIILVFGVMASQFESLLDPFIILFTLPLNFVGIVIVYALCGQKLNVMTAVGVLILVGVIVNNGIVLVDYTNLLRKRGLSLTDACAEAGKSRLRPILMTTLTTVLGLVPMAFFPGEGSEMVQPIGQTILGGLSFGTLMTLFLIPTLYYLFNQRRDRLDEKRRAKLEREEELDLALAAAEKNDTEGGAR